MFGKPGESPLRETSSFCPCSPYGIAKLYAHQITINYRESYGMFAASAILFDQESPRRSPEFVSRKIAMGVARIRAGSADSLELGSLEACRDYGYAGDYARAMWLMLQAQVPDDYVIATGESHSVGEFCKIAFMHVGLDYRKYVRIDLQAPRSAESERLVGNATKARAVLGWQPTVSFEQLVHMMVDAEIEILARNGSNACQGAC
jgi:GDPmannose 4,6-dehydratase